MLYSSKDQYVPPSIADNDTAPDDTVKLDELKDATPFVEVVASVTDPVMVTSADPLNDTDPDNIPPRVIVRAV